MATKTIHDFAAITSIDAADEILAWDDSAGTTRKITWANALTGYLTTTTGLRATGATVGATSQTQVFTNGITIASGAQIKTGSSSDLVLYPASGALKFTTSGGTERGRFAASANTWDIDPLPDATAASAFRFFRSTNTSGTKGIDFYKGDNTATLIHRIGINQATTFNANSEDLDFNIRGDNDTSLFFVDASADRLGIGTTAPSTKAHVLESNAATNAVFNLVTLSGRSAGTAAAGFGAGVAVQLESSTTNDQDAGRLTWAWATATHASRAAIGKLTAYYTSTERTAIAWVADSTGAKVGISESSPLTPLQITADLVGSTDYYGQLYILPASNDADAFISLRTTRSTDRTWLIGTGSGGANAMNFRIMDYTAGADRINVDPSGNVGIGTTAPQGILHGHDGSGGFLFVNRSGVSSTLVTVIPDGTGDVTERLHMFGWVSNSAAFVSQVNEIYLDVSSSTTKTDGSNTLTIAVTAAGAFTLQTTAGAATWKVLLWVFWR